jgi:hypothetical protein
VVFGESKERARIRLLSSQVMVIFEPIIQAFSRMSFIGKRFHGAVSFCVLGKTHRNVGTVGLFQKMRVLSSHTHEDEEEFQGNKPYMID